MNIFPQRFLTCPDCGDPNVPCNVLSHRCDVCSNVHYWERIQDLKRRQLMYDPSIPPLVERNLMADLHLQHAQNMHDANELRTCGTCGQSSGDNDQCVYCRNRRHNPNTRAWRPRHQAPAAASSTPIKRAKLVDVSSCADRELACVICLEDIPAEVERVYYCDCQALICASCETNPGVKCLEKCPGCRKDYDFV
jgi:hypothetical protein